MQVLWNKNKADSYKSRPSYFMKMFPGDSNSGVKIKYRCFLFSVNIWLPRKKIQRSASNGVFINSFWRILYSTSLKKKKSLLRCLNKFSETSAQLLKTLNTKSNWWYCCRRFNSLTVLRPLHVTTWGPGQTGGSCSLCVLCPDWIKSVYQNMSSLFLLHEQVQ